MILYGGDKEDRTPDLLHAISKFPENKLNQPRMYYLNSTNSPICPRRKILLVVIAIQKLTYDSQQYRRLEIKEMEHLIFTRR